MEESLMSIVVRFSPKSLTMEKHNEVTRRLEEAGAWPPDGLDYHIVFGAEGDLRVSEVWDSQEQFGAFGETLMPILAEVGIGFSAEPQIFEIQSVVKR
jgi:hypothetical protein